MIRKGMFKFWGLQELAVVGIVIGLVVTGCALTWPEMPSVVEQDAQTPDHQHANQRQDCQTSALTAAAQRSIKDESAQKQESGDPCKNQEQQQPDPYALRSAQAAERTAALTLTQAQFSNVQTGFIAATILITLIAVWSTHRESLHAIPPKVRFTQIQLPIAVGQPSGKVWLVNEGGGEAYVIRTICKVLIQEKLPQKNYFDDPAYMPANAGQMQVPGNLSNGTALHMLGGGLMDWFIQYDGTLQPTDVRDIRKGRKHVFVIATVMYEDALGRNHHTMVGRVYVPSLDRYVPLDNPDYEYAY